MKIIDKLVFGSVLLLSSQAVLAASQVVSTDPATVQAVPGSDIVFRVVYTTDNGNTEVAGLGLRIHYDSSKLEWTGFDSVFGDGMVSMDGTPVDDTEDFDNDPNTDKYLGLNWISIMGRWPGQVPTALFDVRFQVADGLSEAASSAVNFSSSSFVVGIGFKGVSGVVELAP